jgi:hypothetical protein
VHYLRTTNPLNPENLAVYPRRLGTNRPNAYRSRAVRQAARGAAVYETASAAAALPTSRTTPTRDPASADASVPRPDADADPACPTPSRA